MCLDVLRAFGKSAATRQVVLEELSGARGRHPNFDAAFERFAALSHESSSNEANARRFTQLFVTLFQAGLLMATSPAVAQGFCETRLSAEPGWGAVFGAGGAAIDVKSILERAWQE